MQEVRSNVDVFYKQIFKQATLLAGSVGIEEIFPRITSRQQHHQNIPAQTAQITIDLTLLFLL